MAIVSNFVRDSHKKIEALFSKRFVEFFSYLFTIFSINFCAKNVRENSKDFRQYANCKTKVS